MDILLERKLRWLCRSLLHARVERARHRAVECLALESRCEYGGFTSDDRARVMLATLRAIAALLRELEAESAGIGGAKRKLV